MSSPTTSVLLNHLLSICLRSFRLNHGLDYRSLTRHPSVPCQLNSARKAEQEILLFAFLQHGSQATLFVFLLPHAAKNKLVNPGFAGGATAESLIRASFSPDGRFVVSGSEKGQVRVWEAQEGKRVRTPLQVWCVHTKRRGGKHAQRTNTSKKIPRRGRYENLLKALMVCLFRSTSTGGHGVACSCLKSCFPLSPPDLTRASGRLAACAMSPGTRTSTC